MKVALVTGSNSGIGKALSLEFHKRGYKVYATDRVFSKDIAEMFHSLDIQTHIMDVTSQQDVVRVRDIVASENDNCLDFLYSNAGKVKVGHAVDLQDEEIMELFQLNLFANMRMVREFVRLIINTKGTIAFSGSVTKNLPLHSNALYTASKAALDQYAAVLQCELRNYGVKVIDVIGGYIKTDIFKSGVTSVPEGSVFDFPEYVNEYSQRAERLGDNTEKAMETSIFAKRVLDQIEASGKNTLRVYEGTKSGTLNLVPKVVPTRTLVDNMLNMFRLNFDYRKHLKNGKL